MPYIKQTYSRAFNKKSCQTCSFTKETVDVVKFFRYGRLAQVMVQMIYRCKNAAYIEGGSAIIMDKVSVTKLEIARTHNESSLFRFCQKYQ